MIEEKISRIVNELGNVPEDVLDNILALVEENKKIAEKKEESPINTITKSVRIKPPMDQNKPRPQYVPIEVKGKPMSEMIIEDRR